jgi:GDPmannose 4,6-dehydratase
MLEAVRAHQQRSGRTVRFFQASSSAIFDTLESPQNERTAFHPRNPYACAKAFAHWQTINYREAHGLFACNGILFNHESPRRPERFVSRKITRGAARIKLGLQDKLAMGSLDAERDWGFAGDYVEEMWLMLQHETPDDYVIATGQAHSVREFVEEAFGCLGLDYRAHVELDPQFTRPADADVLCGDASKIRRMLGWAPKVGFRALVRLMVDCDLELARRES